MTTIRFTSHNAETPDDLPPPVDFDAPSRRADMDNDAGERPAYRHIAFSPAAFAAHIHEAERAAELQREAWGRRAAQPTYAAGCLTRRQAS